MLIAIILHFINYWDIAQSVERSAVNRNAVGSSPPIPAIIIVGW